MNENKFRRRILLEGVTPTFRHLANVAELDPSMDFVGAELRGLDFRGEDLSGFNFSRADLTGSDFRKANVEGVSFADADLTGVIMLSERRELSRRTCDPYHVKVDRDTNSRVKSKRKGR